MDNVKINGHGYVWIKLYLQNEAESLIWPLLMPFLGESNGTPLQYSCLENPIDGGAW